MYKGVTIQLKTIYDCIVIGAGPAGSSIAYHLADNNMNVLLMDANLHPRGKPCGGGLTTRAKNLLHVDISPIIEKNVSKMILACDYKNHIILESQVPFAYMIMRRKFDSLLLNAAITKGVQYLPQCTALNVDITPHEVTVQTADKTFTTKTLVGADGATGITHKILNPHAKRNMAWCIEGTTPEGVIPDIPDKEGVFLVYGSIKYGYGWVFPKKDSFSLGIGTFKKDPRLCEYFKNHLSSLNLLDKQAEIHISAHPIPLPTKKYKIYDERIILMGDAAGLADPLSGEGLYTALKSAVLGAECIIHAIRTNEYNMKSYAQAIKDTILTQYKSAEYISRLFYSFPHIFHKLFQTRQQLMHDYFNVINNSNSYVTFQRTVKKILHF
jgi:geranylgeranyl reductase family protein